MRAVYCRRRVLCGLLAVPAGAAFANAASAQAEAELCPAESFDDETSRHSVNYLAVSPHGAERDCRNCEFWMAGEDGGCGGCTLVSGAIDPNGYCDSWALAPQPASASERGA